MTEPDETTPFTEPRKFRQPKKRAPGSGQRRPRSAGAEGGGRLPGSTAERLARERVPLEGLDMGGNPREGSRSLYGIVRLLLNEGWTAEAIRAELRAWWPRMSKHLRREAERTLADPAYGGPDVYEPVLRSRRWDADRPESPHDEPR